jgi:DNA helicase II / ATP-dependent DNA helicase PcrA
MSRVWSKYQEAIFEDVASGTGHTIVNAVAGSGKTSSLLEAINYVPNRGRASVGFYAFNRDIANVLKQRAPSGCDVSTMHSYGLKAVTSAFGRMEIDADRPMRLARELVRNNGEADRELRSSLCKAASMAKANVVDYNDPLALEALVDDYEIDTCPEAVNREVFFGHLRDLMTLMADPLRDKSIGYDDMIWLPVKHNLPVYKSDRVFLDEVQDFTPCQTRLMRGAVAKGGRALACGDPFQAIYLWAGAGADAFNVLRDSLKAKTLPLSITYRCPHAVVRVAKEIVPELEAAPNAIEGTVRDAYYPELAKEAGPGDFILSRTNAPLVGLCLRFLRDGRRAYIAGRDVGATLNAFVKKSGAATVEALRRFCTQWRDAEVKRLSERERASQDAIRLVDDKFMTIMAVSDGADSIEAVYSRLRSLFEESSADRNVNRIMLSTTHKAKGLEADRVWMLADTYRQRPGVEEDNLAYVAITRAKRELVMVHGSPIGDDDNYDE